MISIGILTFFAPQTLDYTLTTYKKSGLLDLTDDVFVIIQNSIKQKEELAICEKYKIRSICLIDNGRMASGFKAIFENAKYDIILFLENDFVNYNDSNYTKTFLINADHFISTGEADIVRARSRTNPGDPNYAYIHLKNICPKDFNENSHLSECIYWEKYPNLIYSDKIVLINPLIEQDDWFKSSSKYCNYTNNPFLCTKDFFKCAILPYIEFGKDIEPELASIWRSKNYCCVYGPGLFTHDRKCDGK